VASIFELHPNRIHAEATESLESLPWHDAQPTPRLPAFAITPAAGLMWMSFDEVTGAMTAMPGADRATVGLKVVPRRLGQDLAVLPRRAGILVNSLPAGPLQLVGTKDSLLLAPGWLCYVTERVKPHVGLALPEHVGKKCPFCRIPIDAKTHVVTCRCGAVYHNETAESHPDTAEADRLRCLDKIKTCLSCNRPLSLAEHLTWDPLAM